MTLRNLVACVLCQTSSCKRIDFYTCPGQFPRYRLTLEIYDGLSLPSVPCVIRLYVCFNWEFPSSGHCSPFWAQILHHIVAIRILCLFRHVTDHGTFQRFGISGSFTHLGSYSPRPRSSSLGHVRGYLWAESLTSETVYEAFPGDSLERGCGFIRWSFASANNG